MRVTHSTLVLAALLFGTALLGQAQTGPKDKDIEQKRAQEKFNGKTLFEWSNDLKDKDLSVVQEAIAALKFYGSAARHEVPAILNAIKSKDISLRVNAVITLGFVGVDPKDGETAVKALSNCLRDGQLIVRYQAIRTLTQFGMNDELRFYAYDATPALINALKIRENSMEIRNAAAIALGYVAWTNQGFDRTAFRTLLDGTSDPASAVRLSSVLSLIVFGKPALPGDVEAEKKVLQGLIIDKTQSGKAGGRFSSKVAIWAYVAIMLIDRVSEGHLQGISKFLKNNDLQSRVHAARALQAIGPQASSQVRALIDALTVEKDSVALIWMITALGNMGDLAKEAGPSLERLRGHQEQAVREAVNKALQDFKEKKRVDVVEQRDDGAKKRKKSQ
jgi:HEAT repeat protein